MSYVTLTFEVWTCVKVTAHCLNKDKEINKHMLSYQDSIMILK